MPDKAERQVALWLLLCCALTFVMVMIGGATRLTGSGLSIVEWKPVTGIIPPLTPTEWDEAFADYRLSPEYQQINRGFTLAEFKNIFWLEYSHRLLGRVIGLVFLLPFLYFFLRGKIASALAPKLALVFVLGGLQGLLGWYMVKSGLIDKPHVSHYRLTAHLAAAFALYGYMLWIALSLLYGPSRHPVNDAASKLRGLAWLCTGLIALTVMAGGLVAGLKAGLVYNTFPLMNGRWFPADYRRLPSLWQNALEHVAAVQFHHRLLAATVFIAVTVLWWRSHNPRINPGLRRAIRGLSIIMLVQISLGIATLLWRVPLPLALAHQAGALALFTYALLVNHHLGEHGDPRRYSQRNDALIKSGA